MAGVYHGLAELKTANLSGVQAPQVEKNFYDRICETPELSQTSVNAMLTYCYNNPRATSEHSFQFFCQYYLPSHFDQGFGEFQYPIFDYLTNLKPGKHTLILFPREHGKSTLFTFAYLLWCICFRKKKHIIIPSAVVETAEKFLMNIKNELQSNALLIRDFGDLIDEPAARRGKRPSRAKYIRTANYVVVKVSSVGGPIRGALENLPKDLHADYIGESDDGEPIYRMSNCRPDLILLDDAVDDKRTMNRVVRDKTWNWFWMNLFSAQQMGESNITVVGTTLHEDDLVSRLLKDQSQTADWFKLCLPAANPDRPFDEHGNPIDCLFPEKWARLDYNRPIEVTDPLTGITKTVYRSFLWHRWRELGPAFEPEFLMRPIGAATRYFKREDFGWYVVKTEKISGDTFNDHYKQTGKLLEYLPDDLICVTTLDPAGTEDVAESTTDPDYTVVMTMGYSPTTKKFYMIALNRMRCSPGDMLRQVLIHLQMFDGRYGGKYLPNPGSTEGAYRGFPFRHLGVGIETVAFQKVLAPMLEELAQSLGMYPLVFELNRGNRRGKRLRAMLPATLCQNNMLMFPFIMQGMQDPSVEALLDELAGFPDGAPHDDTVDALSDGVHILHAYSLQLGRGLMGMAAIQELLSGDFGLTTSLRQEELVNTLDAKFGATQGTGNPMTPAAFTNLLTALTPADV